MYALYTNFILDANCPCFGILGPPGPVAAELCGHRGQMTQILELGIRAISVTPIIFDRSVFSYLKRTKMEDFDQKLSKKILGCYPRNLAAEGATPSRTLPRPSSYILNPPIFSSLWRHRRGPTLATPMIDAKRFIVIRQMALTWFIASVYLYSSSDDDGGSSRLRRSATVCVHSSR